MSVVVELGARVRATADELPLDLLTQALERLRNASERLRWVRQESSDPMGVPELSAATEHVEAAGHALRVAQEQLADYLAAIGLRREGAPTVRGDGPERTDRPDPVPDDGQRPAANEPDQGADRRGTASVRRWWAVRVTELTDGDDPPVAELDRAVDAGELLRRVATRVRDRDRAGMTAQLRGVDANVGLGLAAVAPPLLRELATDLLGHPPKAPDLPRLRRELAGGVRDLLPNLPPAVLDTLLSRVCRMPPPREPGERPNPADPAVAAGVVTGLLLHRLGRDPRQVANHAPGEPNA